jgi:sporulation protein YlmC with PRC-barrel domain
MEENEPMRSDLEIQHCYVLKSEHVKIMTQASVFLPGQHSTAVEIRRGMIFTSIDGKEAGKVAGVVVSPDSGQVQYLILSHLPKEAIYQCIPVSWIDCMQGEVISLNARLETILALPVWHTS